MFLYLIKQNLQNTLQSRKSFSAVGIGMQKGHGILFFFQLLFGLMGPFSRLLDGMVFKDFSKVGHSGENCHIFLLPFES